MTVAFVNAPSCHSRVHDFYFPHFVHSPTNYVTPGQYQFHPLTLLGVTRQRPQRWHFSFPLPPVHCCPVADPMHGQLSVAELPSPAPPPPLRSWPFLQLAKLIGLRPRLAFSRKTPGLSCSSTVFLRLLYQFNSLVL